MQRLRVLGLALFAVFAFAAVASASASAALPEFSPAGSASKPVSFAGTAFASNLFETAYDQVWDYGGGATLSGEITGANEVSNVIISFKGGNPYACTNGKEGEATTNKLKGRLGYINKAKTEVGLLLEAATGPIMKCSAQAPFYGEEYKGSIIAPITPVNTLAKALHLSYEQWGTGKEKFQKFEGEEALHNLELTYDGTEHTQLAIAVQVELKKFEHEKHVVEVEVKA